MRIAARYFVAMGAAIALPWPAAAATVIVTPATAAAPTLGAGLLVPLACLMAALAILSIRRARTAGTMAIAAVGLAMSVATAHLAWAVSYVTVQGENCSRRVELSYNGFYPTHLASLCPNPIRIAAIDPCASPAETLDGKPKTRSETPECVVGMVLGTEESCELPLCPE